MSERAAPSCCPYCAEESIRPWGEDPDADRAQWKCEACTRVFELRYRGMTGPP